MVKFQRIKSFKGRKLLLITVICRNDKVIVKQTDQYHKLLSKKKNLNDNFKIIQVVSGHVVTSNNNESCLGTCIFNSVFSLSIFFLKTEISSFASSHTEITYH